ncbi:cysteine-rich KTR domain-containing protein [Mediterraneibacter agrestimuris]|nr:cysteine-rich KTR domain-containing protein [Mediterraneibacter agrestimuris]
MQNTEWICCPVCGSKTRGKIREDTIEKIGYI